MSIGEVCSPTQAAVTRDQRERERNTRLSRSENVDWRCCSALVILSIHHLLVKIAAKKQRMLNGAGLDMSRHIDVRRECLVAVKVISVKPVIDRGSERAATAECLGREWPRRRINAGPKPNCRILRQAIECDLLYDRPVFVELVRPGESREYILIVGWRISAIIQVARNVYKNSIDRGIIGPESCYRRVCYTGLQASPSCRRRCSI